ncbi:four-helix bundle copper-binding protein [Fulvivirga sp. RKSG066]|nr:four-helix bundle copper-binding protein [Fulvivirga aurantia]
MKPLNNKILQCIDNCNECITAARICLDQHMGEPDMKKCHQLCLDCIALCTACIQMLASQSDYANRICAICADLCKACAEECGKFDSEVCKQCAEKCEACAESCAKMAA